MAAFFSGVAFQYPYLADIVAKRSRSSDVMGKGLPVGVFLSYSEKIVPTFWSL
jgi:hypothetical protein